MDLQPPCSPSGLGRVETLEPTRLIERSFSWSQRTRGSFLENCKSARPQGIWFPSVYDSSGFSHNQGHPLPFAPGFFDQIPGPKFLGLLPCRRSTSTMALRCH
jgi:hypothetical protein